MTLYIAPIVEGQTEERCLERLLHRVWGKLLGQSERLQVLMPFRGKRNALVNPNSPALAQAVQKAFINIQAKCRRDPEARSILLILMDGENDCPAELAPALLSTAAKAQGNADTACVVAKKMLENWIVAGSSPLAGLNGLPDSLEPPSDPEECNGAAWLDQQLRSVKQNRKYAKTVDARIFVEKMDLHESRANSPSFDKLCRELKCRISTQSLPASETETPENDKSD